MARGGLTRLIVSIDHDADGLAVLTLRDDGRSAREDGSRQASLTPADGAGMGLARLRSEVEACGGTLDANRAEDDG